MKADLRTIGGGPLLVPQFTLGSGHTQRHPGGLQHGGGARMWRASSLITFSIGPARYIPIVAAGEFGADMQVSLTNDGPVTFWLEAPGRQPDT